MTPVMDIPTPENAVDVEAHFAVAAIAVPFWGLLRPYLHVEYSGHRTRGRYGWKVQIM